MRMLGWAVTSTLDAARTSVLAGASDGAGATTVSGSSLGRLVLHPPRARSDMKSKKRFTRASLIDPAQRRHKAQVIHCIVAHIPAAT
jgi:hypothetical protein